MSEHRDRVRELYDGKADFGPYATLAPGNRGGRKSRYVAAVFDAALTARLAEDPPFRRLLDLGCGTGIFASIAQRFGAEVVGIDISFGLLRGAARLLAPCAGRCHLVAGDGTRLPFATAGFDRVVAREALCYVPDRQLPGLLAEVHRVVEPGGLVYILDQVSEHPRWQHHSDTPFVTRRSVSALSAAFGEAGFATVTACAVRQPRFPWIYPVWFGWLPGRWTQPLGAAEARWNRYFCPLRTRRWQDNLFVFRKV